MNTTSMPPTASRLRKAVAVAVAVGTFAALADGPRAKSVWVSVGPDGKLAYKATERGDRIADFSFAGYMGGGVALPRVPVKQAVEPPDGDATDAIQAAIKAVGELPPADGVRGAVLLKPGTFKCERPLTLSASGVVLRGSGSGPGGTVIEMTGRPHACIAVRGADETKDVGDPVRVADAYVPSGATTFTLADATGLKAGDTVRIRRPITDAWVAFMGMDALVRDGKKQTWMRGDTVAERTVRAVEGSRVTLDVPLTDSYDARHLNPPGTTVVKCIPAGRVEQVGVESLRIVAPPQDVTISDPHHSAMRLNNVADAWVRDVAVENTVNSVGVGGNARRVTLDRVAVKRAVPTRGKAKPADFSADGSQILVRRCASTGDNVFFFVTGAKAGGPNVLLDCDFAGDQGVQPHQRWATGLLVDSCRVKGGSIDFMDRGSMGSGHGWTLGWGVAWNCVADGFLVQQPPGAVNWVIGGRGERKHRARPFAKEPPVPEGTYDAHGTPVAPASLYLAQLRERLGDAAVKNVGD